MTTFTLNRNPRLVAALFLLVGLIVFVSWDSLYEMVYIWGAAEEYGYGYFIPFISAFLIYQRKALVLAAEYKPSWIGVLIALTAIILGFLGQIATTHTLVQYAFVLMLVGIFWALMGWSAFKLVMGPLALLFFMVPLPPFVLNTLSGQLQLISSEIGVWVIRQFDITVFLEGNVIDLGAFKLQVVEACSGLNYLFPLLSLSFIMAYLYRVEFWKRAIVFLSSIPITVVMNSFRIGVIGWLVENWGIEQAEGFLHYFEGWIIFISCLALLMLEITLLSRVGRQRMSLSEVFNLEWPAPLSASFSYPQQSLTAVHFGLAVVIGLQAAGSLYIKGKEPVYPERMMFNSFPLQFDEWKGKEQKLEDIYLDSLKLDDYIMGDYRNSLGENVNFYTAYYASQQAGSAAHSPRACIPGGGWQIDRVTTVDIPSVQFNEQLLKANRLEIKRGDSRHLVYYWFQQRGRNITNEYMVKWYLFLDGLLSNRTDGALVRLTTPIGRDEEWSDGDKRLVEFAALAVPTFGRYIPD